MGIQEERLYYHDSYRTTFKSQVCAVREQEGYWVRLGESAFYPTSGGQPFDTGWLNETRVLGVEADDEGVWHLIEGPLPVGTQVEGKIDEARRFDFMQQHSGQHVLSACFEQLLNLDTVSFHMGDSFSTIDLDVPEISDSDLFQMEVAANEWVWRDVPIEARFVTADELAALNLRRPPKVDTDVRIVTIVGLEHNPCGGTHPSSTGQIGQILITKTERMRGGVRVQFVCGRRALNYSRQLTDSFRTLGNQLSVGLPEIVGTVESLQSQLKDAKKESQDLKQQLAVLKAEDMASHAVSDGNLTRLVAHVGEGYGANELKPMVGAITELLDTTGRMPYVVVLLGSQGEREFAAVVATADSPVAANVLLKAAFTPVGGKGGGNARTAQGSALTTDAKPGLKQSFETALEELLNQA